MVYNWIGINELGGKYHDFWYTCYALGSLVPAILIGIFGTRVVFESNGEDREKLLRGKECYVIMARVYVGLVALICVFLPFSGYIASFFDQLEMQNIQSFHRMIRW